MYIEETSKFNVLVKKLIRKSLAGHVNMHEKVRNAYKIYPEILKVRKLEDISIYGGIMLKVILKYWARANGLDITGTELT